MDPADSKITVYDNDFLNAPYLNNVITDQHYLTRSREGRHVVFLGKIMKSFKKLAYGIAADEKTAVCVDEKGIATVIGSSFAYFIIPETLKQPEQFEPGKAVVWKHNEQALRVYEVQGSEAGNGRFDLNNFSNVQPTGGKWFWWWAENGKLNKKAN